MKFLARFCRDTRNVGRDTQNDGRDTRKFSQEIILSAKYVSMEPGGAWGAQGGDPPPIHEKNFKV